MCCGAVYSSKRKSFKQSMSSEFQNHINQEPINIRAMIRTSDVSSQLDYNWAESPASSNHGFISREFSFSIPEYLLNPDGKKRKVIVKSDEGIETFFVKPSIIKKSVVWNALVKVTEELELKCEQKPLAFILDILHDPVGFITKYSDVSSENRVRELFYSDFLREVLTITHCYEIQDVAVVLDSIFKCKKYPFTEYDMIVLFDKNRMFKSLESRIVKSFDEFKYKDTRKKLLEDLSKETLKIIIKQFWQIQGRD